MALNNFEKHIKGKLEQREIKPSEEAWAKLSERLEAENLSGKKRPYWQIAVAASALLVLLFGSQFMQTDEAVDSPSVVVEATEVIDSKQFDDEILSEPVEEMIVNNKIESKSNQMQETKEVVETPAVPNTGEEEVAPVIANVNTQKELENTSVAPHQEALVKTINIEEQSIQTIVAQVKTLTDKNLEVTEDDIEKLLQEAQKKITLERQKQKAGYAIDANSLLEGVEEELDQSFREKVFEAIKSGYSKFKTTVAQRNE